MDFTNEVFVLLVDLHCELSLGLHIFRGLSFFVCVADSLFSQPFSVSFVFGGLQVLSAEFDSLTFWLFIRPGVVRFSQVFESAFCVSVSSEKNSFWKL